MSNFDPLGQQRPADMEMETHFTADVNNIRHVKPVGLLAIVMSNTPPVPYITRVAMVAQLPGDGTRTFQALRVPASRRRPVVRNG